MAYSVEAMNDLAIAFAAFGLAAFIFLIGKLFFFVYDKIAGLFADVKRIVNSCR